MGMRHMDTSRGGRRRRRRRGNLVSNLLIGIGVVLLAVAGILWGRHQMRYRQQDKVNRELAVYAEVPDTSQDDDVYEGPTVDWEGLKAINDEVVGWLQIPGTTINYPVYQAADNERYLRNSATGEWTLGGQLFCDFECTRPGMVDALTLIYGHHLLDGSMFEQIAAMDDQERFDEINTVWYVTEDATWECEPLFLYYTQPEDQDARIFNWAGVSEFRTYLGERLAHAVTKRADASEIISGLSGAPHVLCLITCNYYDGYGRTVLVCIPKQEAALATGVAQ